MSRLTKNIVYNLLGQGLLFILSLISVRYIFRQLGEEVLGIIYFTVTVTALVSAINIGILAVTVREVSSHFKSDPGYILEFIRTVSLFFWGGYFLIATAFFFGTPLIVEKWINLGTMNVPTTITMLRILGIASFLTLPRSFYASLFQGLQRMEFNNSIDVATYAIQQFGIILILVLGGGLFHVIYWYAACFVFSILVYLVVSSRFFPAKIFLPKYSQTVIKRNFSFAVKMMFNSTTGVIHTQTDKVIISKLLPVGMLGYYSFAYGVAAKGGLFTGAVGQSALPSFSSLYSKGNRDGLMKQYWKLQDMICFVTVVFYAFVAYALLPLFSCIFNEQTAKMLFLPTALLCLGFYMNSTMTIPYYFSIATGKPGITMRFHLLALFTILPLTAVLIYLFGLIGGGLSLISFYLLAYLYPLPKICSQCLSIPSRRWFKHIGRIFILVFLTYGLAWFILWINNSYSILSLLVAYILATSAFLLGAWCIMSAELKESVLRYLGLFKNFAKRKGLIL